jgi:hypothetical protein
MDEPSGSLASPEEYIRILERMLLLFDRNGRELPKRELEKMIAQLRAGEPLSILKSFYRIIAEKDSVFEGSLSSTAIPTVLPQALNDEREMNLLRANLAERMCNEGLGSRFVRDDGITHALWAGDQAKAERLQKVSFEHPKPTLLKKFRDMLGRGA